MTELKGRKNKVLGRSSKTEKNSLRRCRETTLGKGGSAHQETTEFLAKKVC